MAHDPEPVLCHRSPVAPPTGPTGLLYLRGSNAPGRWVDHFHDGVYAHHRLLGGRPGCNDVCTAVAAAQNGNGAPSGTHYSLNIIGVPRDKNSNPDWASGHVIFVNLGTKNVTVTTKILLSQSAEAGVFDVLDKNGTDGEASFSLPAPGSSPSGRVRSVRRADRPRSRRARPTSCLPARA